MGILDSQGPKSRCDPGTSNWALIRFKSWEGGDISCKLITILLPSSRYPSKIQKKCEFTARKNVVVIHYIFEQNFIKAWKIILEKSIKHPFPPLLPQSLIKNKYKVQHSWRRKNKFCSFVFIDFCTRLDWTGVFSLSIHGANLNYV